MNAFLRTSVFLSCIFGLFQGLYAEPWKIDLNANLTTALNSYSNNWTGGEAGSFTWASQFLGVAERQLSAKLNTKTTLKLQFGQTALQNKTSKNWSPPEKSSDLIDGEELLRFTLNAWVDPFISVRAISQFLDGSDILLVRYGNPLDITEAAGVSKTLKKSELIDWSTRLGAAARQYIDRRRLDTATGTRKTDVTKDGGVELNMDLKAMNEGKWMTLLSSLRLYEALISSKSDAFKGTDAENDWRYPHLKWENTLTLSVSKYLMLGVTAYAYFDKDLAADMRLKETFSAGLTYIYSNSAPAKPDKK
jgi:hypothetical protein